MGEVDLDLSRAAFLQDAVDLEALHLCEIVDVVDHLAIFINRRHRIGLLGGSTPPRASHRRNDRLVRIDIARDQKELHLRRDNGSPAIVFVKPEHPLENVARRDRYRVALLILDIVDDLQGPVGGPGRCRGSAEIGFQDHVRFGEGPHRVFRPFAGDRLQEDRIGQEEPVLKPELRRGHGLAPCHAGNVGDDTFHLVQAAAFEIIARRLRDAIMPVFHEGHGVSFRGSVFGAVIRPRFQEELGNHPADAGCAVGRAEPVARHLQQRFGHHALAARVDKPSTKLSSNSGCGCTEKASSP